MAPNFGIFEWKNQFKINVAKPILREDGAIFISTSYGKGAVLLRVKQAGGKWKVEETDWETNPKFKLKFGDAVKKDGLIYGLSEGILTCLDLANRKNPLAATRGLWVRPVDSRR